MASTTGRQGNVDSVSKKGPQVAHVPDVEPYLKPGSFSNFENFSPGSAKSARGHKPVDPRNVRGSSNHS